MTDPFKVLYGALPPKHQKVAVANDDWLKEALARFDTLPKLTKFSGEDLQDMLKNRGLPDPAHYNAWGALVRILLVQDRVCETGDYVLAKAQQKKSRRLPVYVKV